MDINTCASILRWQTQLEQVCTQLDNSLVNIIVDQAGDVPPLVQDLQRFEPEIDWVSLLENEPENEYIDDAPLFLQLKIDIWQHKEWLSALLRHYADPARMLSFFSRNDFSSLATHLQTLTIAQWEGRKGLMRFYDTRIFPTLVESVLNNQQKKLFLDIAQLWSWRDRDGNAVWLQGENQEYDFSNVKLLNLSDEQYSQLGAVSDIEGFIKKHNYKYPEFTPQSLFSYLWQGVQVADKKGIIDTELFLMEYLS